MTQIEDTPIVSPFNRGEWHGQIRTFDDTSVEDFMDEDLDTIVAYDETDDEWDGDVAGIALLKDGRFVTWETFYGPTGDGFSEDAYGGDADIIVSSDLHTAVTLGLTDRGRARLGFADDPAPEDDQPT
jgi:hypothetical protein